MKSQRRTLLIFYLLIGYIFISFLWWIILLARITNDSYTEKRDLLQLNFIYQNSPSTHIEDSPQMQELEKENHRKHIMIWGEGSFFLIILIVVTFIMNRALRREINVNRQQKNFLLSITHELRSPIASSKVAMQTLLKRKNLEVEKSEMLLNNSLMDMDRLQGLVENLLLATKIEDHSFKIGNDACDLSAIANKVIEKTHETIGQRRNFEINIEQGVEVVGDKTALTSVINNLVENAVKYSLEGSLIKINLKSDGSVVLFTVADNGIGIPDGEKKRIFQKFYRVGQEETRKTKGTGLGLYIVDRILQMHHGNVLVTDNVPAGSVFEVTLPKG